MMLPIIIILFSFWIQVISSLDSIIICENLYEEIDCDTYYHIQVLDATYGRTNSSVCPHDSVSITNVYNCTMSTVSNLSTFCDFKQTCSLDASNGADGGDPCPNVYKYLNVSYDCVNTDTTYINMYETTTTKTNRETIRERTTAIEVTQSNSHQCTCPCSVVGENKWGFLGSLNLTMEQMKTIMQSDLNALIQKIKINTKNTTKYLSTKYSASDDRKSSASIGYVGIIVICMVFGGIVVIDILRCCR